MQLVLLLLFLVPDRGEAVPIDLTMKCNYGELKQIDNKLTIYGDEKWTAFGKVLPNGKILLWWHWKGATDPIGIGLYERDDNGNLRGTWEYLEKLTVKQAIAVTNGQMHKGNPDYIYKCK